MDTNKLLKMVEESKETKEFMEIAKQAAINTGVTVEEWNKSKEVLFYMCILKSPEVLKELSNQVWQELQELTL